VRGVLEEQARKRRRAPLDRRDQLH
jgi:hypothetical protein